MTAFSSRALFWAPRALTIAFIAFLSLFALDVFGEHQGFWRTLLALAMHLIPSVVLVVVLVLAWRWEWVGTALFTAAGLLYVANMVRLPLQPATKLSWCVIIAGPLFVIAALFLINWLKHNELRARG